MPTRDPEKKRAKEKGYRNLHPDKMKEIAKRYKDKDRYLYRVGKMATYYRNRSESRRKVRENHQRLRRDIIFHYGGRCNKCGIDDERVLTIDHVNGGGITDRKNKGGPHGFYRWIVKNNYPPYYQILCHNCNWIKRIEKGEYRVATIGVEEYEKRYLS